MTPQDLTALLTRVKNSECSITEAVGQLDDLAAESLTDACIDHGRHLRTGIPEMIYGASKSAEQIIAIAAALLKRNGPVVATRVDQEKATIILAALPELQYCNNSRIISGKQTPTDNTRYRGTTLILTAGTSDIAVAEEARITLKTLGHPVASLYDVGVAGLHRLLSHKKRLDEATTIIVVAGMEGALPSVVAGLVHAPVIAVPTSVGYGASFGGIAALLGMLNSCAPGVAVVNIDNGFGAACMADAINRRQPQRP
ncbi:MAG: 1-(5-phosphoribosyl)-5-amino-4-imidazole-carboxylate carboxylase [Desulfotalea sp.]|nr:MAG: 1-(5-phosphoribosyl)-5-amino-4-imidazole-carboxylate carboxylase [Desulfotalea sp.]